MRKKIAALCTAVAFVAGSAVAAAPAEAAIGKCITNSAVSKIDLNVQVDYRTNKWTNLKPGWTTCGHVYAGGVYVPPGWRVINSFDGRFVSLYSGDQLYAFRTPATRYKIIASECLTAAGCRP